MQVPSGFLCADGNPKPLSPCLALKPPIRGATLSYPESARILPVGVGGSFSWLRPVGEAASQAGLSGRSTSMADDATKKKDDLITELSAPVLPLRDIVVFPHMIVPLFVGREKSVRALEEVMNDEKQILLLTQKNKDDDDPGADGLHRIGTLATVLQLLKLPDQTVRVLVEGKSRARVTGFVPRTDFFQATIERIADAATEPKEIEALLRTVKTNFEQYIKLNKKVPAETLTSVAQ